MDQEDTSSLSHSRTTSVIERPQTNLSEYVSTQLNNIEAENRPPNHKALKANVLPSHFCNPNDQSLLSLLDGAQSCHKHGNILLHQQTLLENVQHHKPDGPCQLCAAEKQGLIRKLAPSGDEAMKEIFDSAINGGRSQGAKLSQRFAELRDGLNHAFAGQVECRKMVDQMRVDVISKASKADLEAQL